MLKLLNNIKWYNYKDINKNSIFSKFIFNLISMSSNIVNLLIYFINTLILPFSSVSSIFGFAILLTIIIQVLSGFFLAWYYIPEPGLVIELREEMFIETKYGYEIFSLHVRGVDVIFILSYFHIIKKLFLKNYINAENDGWMLGGYAFFWFHYIVGLGICLSASHLSDLTLTIAANIYWSLLNNSHKSYYFIFTNKHLNTDELLRLMILHYLSPWYYLYLVKMHILFCHENWDNSSEKNIYEDKSSSWLSWFYDALIKEIQDSINILIWTFLYFFFHHLDTLSVHYSFFERWNISELDEIRFYGVAPHWYFRPIMSLLTVAPSHFEGILWLVLYFLFLSFLPVIYNIYIYEFKNIKIIAVKDSLFQSLMFIIFILSLFTVSSQLAVGKMNYDDLNGYSGSIFVKWSYQYIYFFLGFLIHNLDIIENTIFNLSLALKKKLIK